METLHIQGQLGKKERLRSVLNHVVPGHVLGNRPFIRWSMFFIPVASIPFTSLRPDQLGCELRMSGGTVCSPIWCKAGAYGKSQLKS